MDKNKVGEVKEYALAKAAFEREGEKWRGVLEVSVSYSLGGANYFQGTQEKRGYWLHVTPVDIRDENGYSMKAFTIGSGPRGIKAFLLPVERRSKKADAQALALAAGKERDLIDKVLEQGLTLAEGVKLPERPAEVPALPSGTIKSAPPAPLSAGQIMPTKEQLAALPAMGATSEQADPLCVVKFFDPCGSWTWYGIEFDPKAEIFYGYVIGHEAELGEFSLAELRSVRGPMGLGIERDIHFKPTPLSAIRAKAEAVAGR